MKGNKHMKTITNIIHPLFALFAFACFAPLQNAQAVVPAPDGGYANQNTAEGKNALFNLTTGTDNTAIGFNALINNTTGSFNTATGSLALNSNTTALATPPLAIRRSTATPVVGGTTLSVLERFRVIFL